MQTYHKLRSTWGKKFKYFAKFNEKDLSFINEEIQSNIIDTNQDDDYETDEDIWQRSLTKVTEDLLDTLEATLSGNWLLRSATVQFLKKHEWKDKEFYY